MNLQWLFIAIILTPIFVFVWNRSRQGKVNPLICKTCGSVGNPVRKTKGSFAIEIVLWLFLIIPGLIYSIWRLTTRHDACPVCGSPDVIPVNTPVGQSLKNKTI